MDSKHKKTESTNILKNSIITIIGLAIVGTGLWALMFYSAPPSNLVPYESYQESQKSPEAKASNPNATKNSDSAKSQETATTAKTDLGNLVKTATSTPSPQSTLPRKTLEHIQKAMELTEKGEFNAGNIEFEKASVLSPDSPDLYSIWGAALRMAKKFKGADTRFARAHELSPNDSEITFNWGMSQLEGDLPEDAIRLFQKTIDLDPNNLMAYNLLGKSYGRKKMYDEEVAAYKKAIEIEPNFALVHFNLGIVLGIQKKFESAAPHFLKAIELDKQYEKPFVVQMLTALGKYDPSAGKPINQPKPVKKPEPVVEEAKATEVEPKVEEKKEEGSGADHKMEGSKKVNKTTNVKGTILINGKPPSRNTLVFLETKTKMRIKEQKKGEALTINQNGLNFQPRHSIVQVGATITFSNHDKEVHNIYSKSQGNQFNLGAMASGSFKSIEVNKAGPIVLRCNMHKDMIGTLFVVPNGYYTQPNEKGEYEFKNVKSEGYIMQVWAPMLSPEEVHANIRSADLTGVDQTFDFDIKSASVQGEIHDMTDPTDYNAIVDNIEKEMFQAIEDWKNGKKFISRKRMLMAITKHFDGEGLKDAIAKSFSSKRSILLERKLDKIRKEISGYGKTEEPVTEASLKSQAEFAVSQLRNNVKELEARLQPGEVGGK